MHIPDAYLSPLTDAAAVALMAPLWIRAARRTRAELTTRQAPLLGLGAAFAFAVQLFNVPSLGGTSAHALGATLLAILLGPWAALLAMSVTLAVQALLFGDGGCLALAVNAWTMAFLAPFVGYGVYRLVAGRGTAVNTRSLVAAGTGAYLGTTAAALGTALVLGLQPALFHDAAGQALYFPLGLRVTVPALLYSHLLIAGPADALLTVAALAFLAHSHPALLAPRLPAPPGLAVRLAGGLAVILALSPLGLLATAPAWGEWDIAALATRAGYLPREAARIGEGYLRAPMADYAIPGHLDGVAGYLLAAFVGAGFTALAARALVRRPRRIVVSHPRPTPPAGDLPAWLSAASEAPLVPARRASRWLTRLSRRIGALALATAVLALAALSRLAVGRLCLRVAAAMTLFGVPAALSLVLATPRPPAAALALLLLRLGAGASLGLVLAASTRWHEIVASLSRLRLTPTWAVAAALLAHRYLLSLLDTLADLVTARRSRELVAARAADLRRHAGSATVALLARSLHLADEVHAAMRSRGVVRDPATPPPPPWRWRDTLSLAAGALVLAACWWLGGALA